MFQWNLSRIVWFPILFAVFQDLPDSAASSRWSSSRCGRSTGNLHTATGSHARANHPHTKWSTTATVDRYKIDTSVAWRLIAKASVLFLVQDAASYVVLQTLFWFRKKQWLGYKSFASALLSSSFCNNWFLSWKHYVLSLARPSFQPSPFWRHLALYHDSNFNQFSSSS